jgi:hypothetical protein
LASVSSKAGFDRPSIERTLKDITRTFPLHFATPLHRGQFDVLIRESYASYRVYYMGVFMPYPWPFTAARRNAIVSDAANLIASFAAVVSGNKSHTGAGNVGPWARPDPKVERAAVRFITSRLERENYQVQNRERVSCGYDLYAKRGRNELHVEVKGCTDDVQRFFLTRNEWNTSRTDPHWRLIVVNRALTKPSASVYLTRSDMARRFGFEPVQWVARPRI